MSYADLTDDVLPRIPQVQALRDAEDESGLPVTQPSATQAASLLAQVEAEIDGHLRRRGVTTPVTDTEGIATLMPIAAVGAAAAILFAAFPQSEGISGEGGAATRLQERYVAMLADIDAGLLDNDTDAGGWAVSHGFGTWTHPLADEIAEDHAEETT